MRVAVIGTGAMGSLFAALLSPFADVVMLGSWAAGLRAARDPGIILKHLDGSESYHVVVAHNDVSDVSPCEVALIVVKGWQTSSAAVLAKQALATSGLAITLQNGLGNFETIAEVIDGERVVQGVTSEGATLLGPGHVRHAGQGHTYLAANKNNRSQLEVVMTLLGKAGLSASLVDDAQGLIWGKLAINAGINPLTALLQVQNGDLLKDKLTLDIMTQAANEVAVVAAELGIFLPFDNAAGQAITVAIATTDNLSSMAQDIARGMPTEIEQICGEVVRYGRLASVATPLNEALLQLIRAQVAQGDWHNAVEELAKDMRPIFRRLIALETNYEDNRSD
jgi:2-dehydropantoate 2-reductase